jgi:hypothetical protein
LAYAAAALCLFPIITCAEIGEQGGTYLRIAILAYALPWAATCVLLLRLRKSALWSLLLAVFMLMPLLGTATEDPALVAVVFGYALTMLATLFWLRNRRALL